MTVSRHYGDRLIGLGAIGLTTWFVFATVTAPGRASHLDEASRAGELRSLKERLSQQLIETEDQTAAGDSILAGMAWPGSDRADLERQLQETILAAAKASDLTLTSFGPAPGPSDLNTRTIGYTLEGSASWEDTLAFTAGINHLKPPLAIAELSLRTGNVNSADPNAQVGLRIVLWGLAPELEGDGL